MHRLLARQLKLTSALDKDVCGCGDFAQIAAALLQTPDAAAALGALLERVSNSYAQYDRDVKLRTISLQHSHRELEDANEALRTEAHFQQELISSLEDNIESLLASSGRGVASHSLAATELPGVFAQLLKENQAAQRELEYQKYALDEHAIVSISDAEGNILYANQKFCAISGYSEQELLGQNHRLVRSDEHDNELYQALWQTISAGRTWHGELKNRSRDGSHYWVSATITPILGEDGRPERYISIRTDITAQKKLEQALEQERRFLNRLANTLGEGVYALDKQGTCIFVNDEAASLLGWPKDALLGKPIHDIIHYQRENGDPLPAEQCPIKMVNQTLQTYHCDHEYFIRKGGEGFPVEVTSAPLVYGGVATGSVAVFKDISQRRQYELARREALKKAEAATQAKSEFLANMSHEIRTPMNAIIGLSHLALTTELNKQQRGYVEKIQASSRNLLGIINDILDFSKIEAGRLQIESIQFGLDQLLREVFDLNQVRAEDKGLSFSVSRGFDIPDQLVGDPVRINQILTNLISNAIKFTERGSVTVSIALQQQRGDALRLVLTVRDTGVGIAEEHQKTLFDAFTQGDSSTTRKYGGTGLGLSICRQLTELLGGAIHFESSLGRGTCFSIELPLKVAAEKPEPREKLEGKQLLLLGGDALFQAQLERFGLNYMAYPLDHVALAEIPERLADAQVDAVVVVDPQDSRFGLLDYLARLRERVPEVGSVPTVIFTSPRNARVLANGLSGFDIHTCSALATPSTLFDTLQGVLRPDMDAPLEPHQLSYAMAQAHVRGLRVLLAEDNPINTEVARAMLEKMGASVVCAANGQEALDLLAQHTFDIVLMDVQMPVMDGYTAVGRIRSDGRYDELPVIALTAHAMSGDRERSLEAGMTDHITKPIDPDQLFETLVKWGRVPPLPPAAASHSTSSREEVVAAVQPSDLPGLSVASALVRVSGDMPLYLKLLRQYLTRYADLNIQVERLLAQPDLSALNAYAHGLKGVCATLGATRLQAVASELEQLDALPRDGGIALLNTLESAAGEAMQSMRQLIQQGAQEQEQQDAVADEELPTLLAELKPLLQAGDIDALAAVARLRDCKPGDGEQQALISALVQATEQFDFEKAQTLLAQFEALAGATE